MATVSVDQSSSAWVGSARGGVRLRIRAVPGSRREGVIGLHGESLRVAVHAPADRGRANEALVGVLASGLGLDRRDVEVLSGRSGRDKIVSVKGIDEAAVRSRIERLLRAGTQSGGGAR